MFEVLHFDRSVLVLGVRWYLADGLSLREPTEMMSERGISIDHFTIRRWVVHFWPMLLSTSILGSGPAAGRMTHAWCGSITPYFDNSGTSISISGANCWPP
jgi:hypothetical protein